MILAYKEVFNIYSPSLPRPS